MACDLDGKTQQFIYDHIVKHGSVYLYEKARYVNSEERISVICKKHGEFLVSPYFLNGCWKCRGKGRTVADWIAEFTKVHGNKYNYSKVTTISRTSKIEIICLKHGSFFQYPRKHKEGNNCPKCGKLARTPKAKQCRYCFYNWH